MSKLPQIFDLPPSESDVENAVKDFSQFEHFLELGEGEAKPVVKANDYWVDTALENGKLVIKYIGSSFPERERDLILEYLPQLYNVDSKHLQGPILNEVHLIAHLKAEGIYDNTPEVSEAHKINSKKSQIQIDYEKDYSNWIDVCSDRKNKIRHYKNELKTLRLQLKIQSLEFERKIAEAQLALAEVEGQPVPERPSKPEQG